MSDVLRALSGTADERRAVLSVVEASSDYYQKVGGKPGDTSDVDEIFNALPPGKTKADKLVYGVLQGRAVVGVLDLVKAYPNPQTLFIGLLLIREEWQSYGIGTEAFKQVAALATGWNFSILRLAVVSTNAEAGGFWERMGFTATGERKLCKFGTVSSELILYEKKI